VSEQRLPEESTVDISRGGLLLAFTEPVGFPIGQRIVVSIEFIDGTFHVMGVANRVERGTDFQAYVAMTFTDMDEDNGPLPTWTRTTPHNSCVISPARRANQARRSRRFVHRRPRRNHVCDLHSTLGG